MQFGIRDMHRSLWSHFSMYVMGLRGQFWKCSKSCISQCLLIGYILFIKKWTRILLLCTRLQARPWESNSESAHSVSCVHQKTAVATLRPSPCWLIRGEYKFRNFFFIIYFSAIMHKTTIVHNGIISIIWVRVFFLVRLILIGLP